jgi:hypothetical protein
LDGMGHRHQHDTGSHKERQLNSQGVVGGGAFGSVGTDGAFREGLEAALSHWRLLRALKERIPCLLDSSLTRFFLFHLFSSV